MPQFVSFLCTTLIGCLLSACVSAGAEESSDIPVDDPRDHERLMVEFGPYVYHRVDNTDHNQWPRLIGLEYEAASHWLGGAAFFRNSYYQNAAYIYAGRRWFMDYINENIYVKVSAGLVYGYKDPHED